MFGLKLSFVICICFREKVEKENVFLFNKINYFIKWIKLKIIIIVLNKKDERVWEISWDPTFKYFKSINFMGFNYIGLNP